jgi:hypothetical protein
LGDALLILSSGEIRLLTVGLSPGDSSGLDPVSPSEILLSLDDDPSCFCPISAEGLGCGFSSGIGGLSSTIMGCNARRQSRVDG